MTIVLIIIRMVIRLLSAVSPKSAGALAFWLFCRPPKATSIIQFQRSVETAGRQMMAKTKVKNIGFTDGQGHENEVCVYTIEPDSTQSVIGTTLLLHGWSSRASHMLAFAAPLIDNGYRVIAVDLPGHGRSSGRRFHLPLGVHALDAVRQQTPTWDSIIAHSLGGAVALSLVAGTIKDLPPVKVDRLVLLSTPNSIPKIFADFGDQLKLNQPVRAVLDQHVIRLSGRTLDAFIGHRQLRDSGIATLVLHDPADQEVPGSEALSLTENNEFATYQPIHNVGHRRILYADDAVSNAVDFCTHRGQFTDSSIST